MIHELEKDRPGVLIPKGGVDLQQILRKAMRRKLAVDLDVVDHLIAACAEAAEAAILDIRILGRFPTRPAQVIKVRPRQINYTCKGCNYHRMRKAYQFCPKCGERIYWKSPSE